MFSSSLLDLYANGHLYVIRLARSQRTRRLNVAIVLEGVCQMYVAFPEHSVGHWTAATGCRREGLGVSAT